VPVGWLYEAATSRPRVPKCVDAGTWDLDFRCKGPVPRGPSRKKAEIAEGSSTLMDMCLVDCVVNMYMHRTCERQCSSKHEKMLPITLLPTSPSTPIASLR